MNPFKLEGVTPSGKPAHVWACGQCERTCIDEQHAAECCKPYTCSVCGERAPRFMTKCDACRAQDVVDREQAEFDSAEKVAYDDYTGDMLYLPGEDRYVDTDDLDELEGHRWAWACDVVPCPSIDMHDALYSALNGYYEDAIEQFDTDALQKIVDAWLEEAYVGCTAYLADYTKAVMLPAECRSGGDASDDA